MKKLFFILALLISYLSFSQSEVDNLIIEKIQESNSIDSIASINNNKSVEYTKYTTLFAKILADMQPYLGGSGSGDMLKSIYDVDNNGTVDDSELLSGQSYGTIVNRSNHTGTQLYNTISDFQTGVSANTDVIGNTSKISFPGLSANYTWSGNHGFVNQVLYGTSADFGHLGLSATGIANYYDIIASADRISFVDYATRSARTYTINLAGNPTIGTDLTDKAYNDATYKPLDPLFNTKTANYTTSVLDKGRKIYLDAGVTTVTLDDTGLTPKTYELTLFNNTGSNVTFSLASGDSSLQTLSALSDGQYAYVELYAANTWSVIIGGDNVTQTEFDTSIANQAAIDASQNDDILANKNNIDLNYNALLATYPKTVATSATFTLDNIGGDYANTASSTTSYTVTTNGSTGAFRKQKVNAASEPTVIGATKITGADFQANTDMDIVVYTPDGTTVEYYFLQRITTGGDTTPPTLVSATIEDASPTDVDLIFSESVTGTNLGWTLSGTTSTTFSSLTGSGTTWTGTLGTAAANGETITLSYNSGAGDFIDSSSNALADIVNQSITNNITASTTYGLRFIEANTTYASTNFDPDTADFSIYTTLDSFTGVADKVVFGTTGSSTNATNGAWQIKWKGASTIALRLRDNSVTQETSSFSVSADDIIGVVRSGTSMALYINGSPVEELTITAGFSSTATIMFGAYSTALSYATQDLSNITIDGNILIPSTTNSGAITVGGITLTPKDDTLYYQL